MALTKKGLRKSHQKQQLQKLKNKQFWLLFRLRFSMHCQLDKTPKQSNGNKTLRDFVQMSFYCSFVFKFLHLIKHANKTPKIFMFLFVY